MDNAHPSTIATILLSHAPQAERAWHGVVWDLDAALATSLAASKEPMIRAVRIAWWRDALSDDPPDQASAHPLISTLHRDHAMRDVRPLRDIVEGWDALVDEGETLTEAALTDYGVLRGGGLFRALGGEGATGHGAAFALWDLASHVSTPEDRAAALRAAHAAWSNAGKQPAGLPRVLRVALALARPDIEAGQIASSRGVSGALRLAWAMFGR